MTQGEQGVMQHKLQAGGHAMAARHLLLVLHYQLQPLVEVEGQLGLLYGLTLALTSLLGGVVVQEHVPVMSHTLLTVSYTAASDTFSIFSLSSSTSDQELMMPLAGRWSSGSPESGDAHCKVVEQS